MSPRTAAGLAAAGLPAAEHTVDDDQRAAFLSSCRRHIHEKGPVLIQRYDPEWAADAVDSTSETDDMRYRRAQVHVDHQPDHDRLSAVVSYETDGRRWQHSSTASVLDTPRSGVGA